MLYLRRTWADTAPISCCVAARRRWQITAKLQGAESRKDFIHKLGICLKEIREAQRWLRLIHRVPLIAAPKIEPLLSETEALIKIFRASVRTAEKNTR